MLNKFFGAVLLAPADSRGEQETKPDWVLLSQGLALGLPGIEPVA